MILNDIVLYVNFFSKMNHKDSIMSKGLYESFANRLIQIFKDKGHTRISFSQWDLYSGL